MGEQKHREEQKREDQRRERVRRKNAGARKGRKVAKHCVFPMFFQWFVAPEGRKVGSLKRQVRSPLARWEMKNCTPLWREAHLQVEKLKTPHVRSTFGRWDVEKVHAIVAQSTFPSQNVQKTPCSDHFWKFQCRKSARRCGAKHVSKSKSTKHTRFGPLLEVEMSKKCTPLWREAHFEVEMLKTPHVRATFGRSDVVSWQVQGIVHLVKSEENLRVLAGVGHLKRICKDAFSVADAVQEACSSELLGGPGDDFLRGLHFGASDLQVCWDDFAWQVQHFVWPGITFSWQAQYFRQVDWKSQNTLARGRQLCTQLSIFEGSIAELFRFWCCQLRKWGSLKELFRFWYCQVQTLRKSRRIAAFLMLSSSKTEEVSRNCFVFDVVKFKNWGSVAK